jgi:hypothetical protein
MRAESQQNDSHLFRGIRWGYNYSTDRGEVIHVRNTCALDCIITSLYILHLCKVMTNPLKELSDESSLISRSFQHLDNFKGRNIGGNLARQVWINGLYKNMVPDESNTIDLFHELELFFYKDNEKQAAGISPIHESTRLVFQQRHKCTLGPNCSRRVENGGPNSTWSEPKITVVSTIETTEGKLNESGLKKNLDELLERHIDPGKCDFEYYDNPKYDSEGALISMRDSRAVCDGHTIFSKADIIEWPRLLVFNLGHWHHGLFSLDNPDATTLNDLPTRTNYRDKTLVLRAVILSDNNHYTAVVKLPYCWMHYDGMEKDRPGNIFTRLYAYNCKDSQRSLSAMRKRSIAMVFYEVLDGNLFTSGDNTHMFGDWSFKIETVLAHNGCRNSLNDRMKEAAHIFASSEEEEEDNDEHNDDNAKKNADKDKNMTDERLKGLTKKVQEIKKKKQNNKTTQHKKTKGATLSPSTRDRMPPGFSLAACQKKGKQAKCKSCNKPIDRDNLRVRHSWVAENHKHPTRDQYHCTVECLMKMKPSFLREFMDNPKMSLGKVVKVKKLIEQKLQKTKK